MNKCCKDGEVAYNELTMSTVQIHELVLRKNTSLQFLMPKKYHTKTHTVQTLINDAKDQRESHYRGEKYRGGVL